MRHTDTVARDIIDVEKERQEGEKKRKRSLNRYRGYGSDSRG